MKTKHLIEILRCPGNDISKCGKCGVRESCKGFTAKLSLHYAAANRLEVLLENLRRTEAELKETQQYIQHLEKRHERFVKDIKEAVHEQEILSGLGGY